jgi:hypothetical protein
MTTTTARDELLHGLFTTALEGGIGYWSECSDYRWSIKGDGVDEDYTGFSATITETDDDNSPKHVIDRKVISKGYRLATTTHRDAIAWSTGKPPLIVTDDTDWDYDAGDADCIVQLGLFGKVVYG